MNGQDPVDAVDRGLLQWLQDEFPLEHRPWKAGARKLRITEGEALARARRLSADGIIRTLHVFVNHHNSGSRRSTLVAMRVPEEEIDRVVAIINEYRVITHNYRRNHEYNLWFTISERGRQALQETLDEIVERTGVPRDAILDLRTTRVFKVDVRFQLAGRPLSARGKPREFPDDPPLDTIDRSLLRITQEAIPLVREPFRAIAGDLGIPPGEVIRRLHRLSESGIIKRIGISLNQRKLGIVANALVAWKVPRDSVESIGAKLSSFPEVTHCYERSIVPGRWEYNLFTVLHGSDEASVREHSKRLSGGVGIQDYELLFSTNQYKRTSIIHEFPREDSKATEKASRFAQSKGKS